MKVKKSFLLKGKFYVNIWDKGFPSFMFILEIAVFSLIIALTRISWSRFNTEVITEQTFPVLNILAIISLYQSSLKVRVLCHGGGGVHAHAQL